MRPILIHTHHFPPQGYNAITLFPFVFHNEPQMNERELRHETIHLWQQLLLLVVLFYVLYLFFWLIGLLRYRNLYHAYRSIPFERSAYRLDSSPSLPWHIQSFDWIRCLKMT